MCCGPNVQTSIATTYLKLLKDIYGISWFAYIYNKLLDYNQLLLKKYTLAFNWLHNFSQKVFDFSYSGHPPNAKAIFVRGKKISLIRSWGSKEALCCLCWKEWKEAFCNPGSILEWSFVSRTTVSGRRRIWFQSSNGWPHHPLQWGLIHWSHI